MSLHRIVLVLLFVFYGVISKHDRTLCDRAVTAGSTYSLYSAPAEYDKSTNWLRSRFLCLLVSTFLRGRFFDVCKPVAAMLSAYGLIFTSRGHTPYYSAQESEWRKTKDTNEFGIAGKISHILHKELL